MIFIIQKFIIQILIDYIYKYIKQDKYIIPQSITFLSPLNHKSGEILLELINILVFDPGNGLFELSNDEAISFIYFAIASLSLLWHGHRIRKFQMIIDSVIV